MKISSSKGRYISRNPIEEQFLTSNSKEIQTFTDFQIRLLANKNISRKEFFYEYLPRLGKEIKEKFSLTKETEFLISNIEAPIIVRFLESEENN